jgi:hypothetical protein
MAITISRAPTKILFPVEILRALLPMIHAGLKSTQLRIRQATYRYLIGSPVLNEQKWLNENAAISLLEALDLSRRTFEADIFTPAGEKVEQTNDLGDVEDLFVEMGCSHPGTLRGVDRGGLGGVEWVWGDSEDREVPLGIEEVFSREQWEKVYRRLEQRVSPD